MTSSDVEGFGPVGEQFEGELPVEAQPVAEAPPAEVHQYMLATKYWSRDVYLTAAGADRVVEAFETVGWESVLVKNTVLKTIKGE